ncbi:MAG: LysE family translocator [Rubrivivax sp.]
MADVALLQQLPLFMATVLVLNATPGVDLLLTVSRTAQSGMRAGIMAALGINADCALHALAAAFGLAALLAWSAAAFTLLKWAGAAYLVWLGIGMLRAAWRPTAAAATGAHAGRAHDVSPAADFRRGPLTNLLNPKVALFMLAVVALTARVSRLPLLARSARGLQAAGGLLFFALAARLAGTRTA